MRLEAKRVRRILLLPINGVFFVAFLFILSEKITVYAADKAAPVTPPVTPPVTLKIIYFIGSQYSDNPTDGKDYYTTKYENDPKIYMKGGPHCCTTGYSAHGQKLAVVPRVALHYFHYTQRDTNMLTGFDFAIIEVPSLFEWTEDAACLLCLSLKPTDETLWMGTAEGLSLRYTSELLQAAVQLPLPSPAKAPPPTFTVPIIVGPTYAIEAADIVTFVNQFKVIVLGYSTPDFDRSADVKGPKYPNFFNVVPNHDYPHQAASAVVNELIWYNQLTIIHINETWSVKLAKAIYNTLSVNQNTVYRVQVENDYYSMDSAVTSTTRDTYANRTIILIGRNTEKAQSRGVYNPVYSLLCMLSRANYKSPFNVEKNGLLILPEQADDLLVTASRLCYNATMSDGDCGCSVTEMRKVILGAVMIGPYYGITPVETPEESKEPFYNLSNLDIDVAVNKARDVDFKKYYADDSAYYEKTSKYAWYAYDALMLAIYGLDRFAKAYVDDLNADTNQLQQASTANVLQAIKGPLQRVVLQNPKYSDLDYTRLRGMFKSMVLDKKYHGVTGPVRFNVDGDREADMYVYQFDDYANDEGSAAAAPIRGVVKLADLEEDAGVYHAITPWQWYTLNGKAPVTYSLATQAWRTWAGFTVAGVATAILAPLITKFGIMPFRRYSKIRSALTGRWYRPAEMIRKIKTLHDPGVYVMTRATHHCFEEDAIDAALHSNHGAYRLTLNQSDKKMERRTRRQNHLAVEEGETDTEKIIVIVNVARSLRGATNVTRQLTRDIVRHSRALFSELVAMQTMVGKRNVAHFFGCVFTQEIVGTCYEWQPNGTLQQMIKNAPFELDLELTLSLISDVVKGVTCLYSGDGLSPHGRISSKVIFLTRKFDCQVANYGLPGFRDGFAPNWKGPDLLWSCPEILQNQARAPTMGSTEGDVWSIAVIISELVNHATPYAKPIAQRSGDIEAVLDDVAGGAIVPELFSFDRSTPALEKLVSRMCSFVPNERVSLAGVAQTLKSLLKAENVAVEQFSEKVLSRVADWTDRLEVTAQRMMHSARMDRQRSLAALMENVPASIARRIVEKQPVEPCVYNSISLLMVDLPAFVLLSDVISPAAIVGLLQEVLKTVREVLAAHSMVNQLYQQLQTGSMLCACGVPAPEVADHTLQISLFALHLIYKFCTKQFQQLKLFIIPRCAVAAGGCVGGLLCDEMRYTYAVFGEIVDDVGVLLTKSGPAKLLCSEKFVELIQTYERFVFKRSGTVKIRDASVRTYLLEADVEQSNTEQPQNLKVPVKQLIGESIVALETML